MEKRLTDPPSRHGDTGAGVDPALPRRRLAWRLGAAALLLAVTTAGYYLFSGMERSRLLEAVAHRRERDETPLWNPFVTGGAHRSHGRLAGWVQRHRPLPVDRWNDAVARELDHFDPVTDFLLCEDHRFTPEQWRGVTKLRELRTLSLRGSNLDDAMAHSFPGLKNLVELDVSETMLTDAALASVGELKALEYLFLTGVPVTDEGLKRLAGLTNLRRLEVDSAALTDASAGVIADLPLLTELSISGTSISDAGVAAIAGGGALESFSAGGDAITDASVRALLQCGALTALSLDESRISDDGLRLLAATMPQLRDLSVNRTAVTDEGVKALGAITMLNFLSLHKTGATRETVAQLQHENSGLVVAPSTLTTEFD